MNIGLPARSEAPAVLRDEYTIRGGAERAALLYEASAVPFSVLAADLSQRARCCGAVLGLGWLRGMLQGPGQWVQGWLCQWAGDSHRSLPSFAPSWTDTR